MVKQNNDVFCDNCGVEITWAPVVKGEHHYCCQECFQGLACDCGKRMEDDDDRREENVLGL